MSTFLALLTILLTIFLPFLDKIFSYMYPKGPLSNAEEECYTVFDIGDCYKIPNK